MLRTLSLWERELRGVMPVPAVRNDASRLLRPPAAGLVFRKRRPISKHGIHDSPRLLHAVVTRKQRRIAANRIAEKPLVRRHGIARLPVRNQFDILSGHRLARSLHTRSGRN